MGAQMEMFHNTTRIDGAELAQAQSQAKTQTDLVLSIFQDYPKSDFTPWEVLKLASNRGGKMMITSVRRSITDLTGAGYLRKTGKKRCGDQQASNYTWELSK